MEPISKTKIDNYAVQSGIAFHANLNPKLWNKDVLQIDVRTTLLSVAYEFVQFLDVPNLKIKDVIFTGSNAAYNFTKYSDIDVHIVIDFDKTICPDLAENFFNTKRMFWNQTHDITVRGFAVELYVEDTKNGVTANGIFSLLKNEWIKKPTKQKPEWDDSAVMAKVLACLAEIENVLENPSKDQITDIFSRLSKMRKAGLAIKGELSVENLAFKTLRNLGVLDRLAQARLTAQDHELSLESSGERD